MSTIKAIRFFIALALAGVLGVAPAWALLQVTNLSGFGGASSGTITQKGYGYVVGASATADLALSYGTVSSGSAPAAGDLVVWIVMGADTVGSPLVDLTTSGWTQSRITLSGTTRVHASILANVVESTDISSPPTAVDDPTEGSVAMWVAYTLSGSVPTLTANSLSGNYSSGSAPTDVTVDSSALAATNVAITLALGTANDNSVNVSWSGATEDISLFLDDSWDSGGNDAVFEVGADLGGVNVTLSKGDDLDGNSLAGGYIGVVW